ncbi:MAG TPA: decarboxylating 6-phosphogluconate dehydrogenase [Anaerolineae bacterium]|nr:decarboxylating 6-phosphogluconate dehydrogenase [Anaerolineae bacterium]
MDIGMVGLGKMGANMSKRLLADGHRVVVSDLNEEAVKEAEAAGAEVAAGLADFREMLVRPRAVWVMVPAGKATDSVVTGLADSLEEGDIVIDGGNSNYKETVARGKMLGEKGLHFVDVGTSGGVWGLAEGYSMMVGGAEEAVAVIRPALESLAPGADKGWGHVGPSGAGHFVKMVHNGIEYGMMQAYAEGFEIMKAKDEFGLDLHQVAEIWRFGSVVRSWLLDLTANALAEDQNLSDIRGWVADSGEGRWTVFEAIDLDIPAPVITASLMARFVSRQDESYGAKLLAAMRNQFGGHAVKEVGDDA